MKEIYTFTTNKTASVSDFSLLLLDYLSRDDEDVKTFGTRIKDMDGRTVMKIDSDEDTILFDRHLFQDVLKDIMSDVASLAHANHVNPEEDKSEDEDAVDDEDEDGIDNNEWEEWEMDDEDDDEEDEEDEDEADDDEADDKNRIIPAPCVTVADGRTFHVGDRVRATCGNSLCRYSTGDCGVILDVDLDDDTIPLLVRFDNGSKIWSRGGNLDIISE